MKISELTRRDLCDALTVENVNWAGHLEEQDFLSRIFDLSTLPSYDHRFKDAAGDIWQHRVLNFEDWDDNWVFYDSRFNLLNCDDEIFLRFLCETLHPVVRPDVADAKNLCQMYNSHLKNDGFHIVEKSRISGKPVYVGRHIGFFSTPGVSAAKSTLSGSDVTYVAQQITRMEAAVDSDPNLAIGTAKELIETCCKTILHNRNVDFPGNSDLPQLAKLTGKELKLTPDNIPDQAKAAATIKRLLSNLAMITQGVSELRNKYGTGHGKKAGTKGLSSRHAKLAVGAASTLAVFLVETHQARNSES